MPPTYDRPASAILDPFKDVFRLLREAFDRRIDGYQSDRNGYLSTVRALLHASDQTFRAILFLVADQRVQDKDGGNGPGPFPAQSIILQRSLFEVLANVLAILESPIKRDALFRRDGYRENSRKYEALRSKLKAGKLMQRRGSKWLEALDTWQEDLQKTARYLRLTPQEIADSTTRLKSWPRPPQMLGGKKDVHGIHWLTGQRLEVVRYFDEDSYGSDSRVVHQKDRALYMSMLQSRGLTLAELGRVRNIVVLRAATIHGAVLAEVGEALGWPRDTKKRLRIAWRYLIQDFDPALEVYRARYRAVLKRGS
jgi:hypothetical protein